MPEPEPPKPPRDRAPKAVRVDPPPPKRAPEPEKQKTRTDRPAKSPGSGKPGRKPDLQKQIEGGFMTIAIGVSVLNWEDGQIVGENAEALAASWYKVAQQNAHVRKFFERMTETGAWGEAVVTTGMVAIPIAQNHGLIPGEFSLLSGLSENRDSESDGDS